MKIILALFLIGTAKANIGFSVDECRRTYGPEVKTEPAWCGGTGYSFINDKLYIYAIVGANGRVSDISYFSNVDQHPLEQWICEKLWLANQRPGPLWDTGSPNYNYRKNKKQLGYERYEHTYQWSPNSSRAHVANRKNKGYQIRTLSEFQRQQKLIKKLYL
jgi:hypothetical protein